MERFYISPEVEERYPSLQISIFRVSRADIAVPLLDPDKTIPQSVQAMHTPQTLEQHPFGEYYRAFYAKMGLKPSDIGTPIKQAKRVLVKNAYRAVDPVVDMCMLTEYLTLVSFQIYDAAETVPPYEYRFATDMDTVVADRGIVACKSGELIFADAKSILQAPSVGNSAQCKVTPQTREYLIRILKVPGIPEEIWKNVLQTVRSSFRQVNLIS